MFEFLKKKKPETGTLEIKKELPTVTIEEKPETAKTPSEEPKLDLLMAKVESLKLQYEAMKEKLENIERMVKELYQMAKS